LAMRPREPTCGRDGFEEYRGARGRRGSVSSGKVDLHLHLDLEAGVDDPPRRRLR
jgi:hypothetical protein